MQEEKTTSRTYTLPEVLLRIMERLSEKFTNISSVRLRGCNNSQKPIKMF